MVGLQSTTASLAKCYEGTARRINYPLMKNFEVKRTIAYAFANEEPKMVAEAPATYESTDNDEELPF